MRITFKRPAIAVALCCFAASGLLFTIAIPAASQPENNPTAASTASRTSDTPYDPDGDNSPPPSSEPADGSSGTPTGTPTPNPSGDPSESPSEDPSESPSEDPSASPTPTEKPKPTSKPTQKPTEKPVPEQPDEPEDPPADDPRLPNTGPPSSSPLPPDGRFNSDSSGRQGGYPDTGNSGTNWVPQSPSPGSGGYAEQNHGAVNDPVPTPEAEQAESSEDGSRNSALKGSQAGADNAEARSSSLLWGGLTILVGLAVIVAAWLFLRRSQKDQEQRG
ncbi:hypothetical protein HMPREF3172_03685 [Brevibacterium sp. HMSC08F02]|uniref:hypothetical protein n=1 Tax=unclassified Brevibacterium TaxID=2614124 RepID=UPI0008A4B4A2|nr:MULTISPECIES: hypothetical protein [unclassified Brevibacterium]OFT26421.1 hypothetical protein HMPREF3172_03685 [Brevibacterium sp. HMSC08F02]OFT93950.1 hypothetical protein HMPREF3092_04380 [Brevibacterium sp. HMSC24B04]